MELVNKELIELKEMEEYAKAFKVLANPARLCILCQLYKKQKVNVTWLVCCSNYAQSYVSQELAKLKQLGIVECEKVGNEIFYSLIDQKIYEILKATYMKNC